ncbi:MAG TPA: hypothetical protein VFY40_03620 [Blastocatellia bacterium]|nr:hypothetical protein [Blastocatellia bacterium]
MRCDASLIVYFMRFNAGYSYFTALRQDYSATPLTTVDFFFAAYRRSGPPPPGGGELLLAYQGARLPRLAVCKVGASAQAS